MFFYNIPMFKIKFMPFIHLENFFIFGRKNHKPYLSYIPKKKILTEIILSPQHNNSVMLKKWINFFMQGPY